MLEWFAAAGLGATYKTLAEYLCDAIVNGEIPLGSKLPSERLVAKSLKLSRTTVQNAYRRLESRGLVQMRPHTGTYVSARVPGGTLSNRLRRALGNPDMPSTALYFERLDLPDRGAQYGFELGEADPHLLPLDEFKYVVDELFTMRSREVLMYSPTEGLWTLRQRVAEFLRRYRGFGPITAENVLITTGSMQGLNLVATRFLRIDDVVVTENPTFHGAIQIFRMAHARIESVKLDADGIRVDELEGLLERVRPRFVYVQPVLHNPTGAVLSAERRAALLKAAAKHELTIVEDDAYGLLADEHHRPLLANLTEGPSIYIGTFSKLIAPGLRVGYIVAQPQMIRYLASLKQFTDLHTSGISQLLIEGWLATGNVSAHIKRCKAEYAARLDVALAEIARGNELRPIILPRGGFYVFCSLPERLSAAAVKAASAQKGVSFALGEYFSPAEDLVGQLRLSVSTAAPPIVRTGLRRLAQVIRSLRTSQPSRAG